MQFCGSVFVSWLSDLFHQLESIPLATAQRSHGDNDHPDQFNFFKRHLLSFMVLFIGHK